MNALVKTENTAIAAITEQELVEVLQSSLYPGASLPSIKLVLGYCKASGLDPMQKPVHIVPMKVSSGKKDNKGWDIKEMRDVVMPGVGLYRSQAAKTGEYVGMSEPNFGPTKALKFQAERWVEDGDRRKKIYADETMEYPEWCSITVRRAVNGIVCEFPAREYWLENYATKSNDSAEPNAMWRKRPFGQISKCAEAQALRKAFPGQTGSQPTAEEMEGKLLTDETDTTRTVDVPATEIKAEPTYYPQADFDANLAVWKKVIAKGTKPDDVIAKVNSANAKTPLSDAQKEAIRALAPVAPATPKAASGAVELSHAKVLERMDQAKNEDDLNVIMDLACQLTRTEAERAVENAKYDACLTTLRK